MYCGTCGKQLPEGAKFCYACGAVVQDQLTPAAEAPPAPTEPIKPVLKTKPAKEKKEKKAKKEKKERKKIKIPYRAIIAAAVVVILVVSAVLLYPLLAPEKMVEVYVVTSCSLTLDGEPVTWEYEWDENGNLTNFNSFNTFGYYASYELVQNPEDYASMSSGDLHSMGLLRDKYRVLWASKIYRAPIEAEYDENGNLIKVSTQYTQNVVKPTSSYSYEMEEGKSVKKVYEYDYTFDKKGRIETCEISYNGDKVQETEYTWDKRGNLIRIVNPDVEKGHLRTDWEYDSKNRLTAEWIWDTGGVYYYSYEYDQDGNVVTFSSMTWFDVDTSDYEDGKACDLDEEDAFSSYVYTYSYNKMGDLISYTVKSHNINTRKASTQTKSFTYDAYGNPELEGIVYDEHGNLLSYNGYTYTYEKVEMTAEAAQRYYQWEGAALGGSAYSRIAGAKSIIHTYYRPDTFDPLASHYLILISYPYPNRPQ